jgi:hypothetical protein
MIFEGGDPSNFHMKQSMIIKIRTITYKNDKIVLVTASKIRSTNENIDATNRIRTAIRRLQNQ